MATSPPAGGFMLSPPASSTISNTSRIRSALPHPRGSPLRPGGTKESAFIRYVDQRILHIQRRFAKRTTPSAQYLSNVDRDKADAWGDVKGYTSMKEACKDIDELIGVVWVSGTPSLQVPYLIGIGLLMGNIVQSMPPSRSLFRVLGKLDYAFASLLQRRDLDSGEALPGFVGGRGLSGTEKVRIRSLVERTRVNVVEAFKRGEFEYEDAGRELDEDERQAATDSELDGGLVLEGDDNDKDDGDADSNNMSIARVYDRTIVEVGESLEEPSIGIITDARR